MRVFVTGGTGAVGRLAVAELAAAGHEVSALARSAERAALLEELGARPVAVSLFDRAALTAAFADHGAVVNLATAIPSTMRALWSSGWRENDRIRTEGSAAVVDAVLAAGVGRLVQESVVMIYPDRGAAWIDEDVPPEDLPRNRANLAAEASARRFTTAGGTGTVLRFGWFYGPGSTQTEEMLRQARLGFPLVLGDADAYTSPIHLADAASAVVAALDAPSGTFNVADDVPLPKREFAAALAEAVGRRRWVGVPGRAARLLGPRVASLLGSLRVSNGRFRAATGWAPRNRSANEGWPATAAALM
ncbi:NAD(P)-dependent oxidoreductase [Pseudonocardia sp. DSM 110487]|uniref:NAD-dependent epimerase/dehydratase family protein n=1 Tax=Pseudonocardia sp. DSM 110487 TaxID=2865833 RepID=UPI001C697182|nr:NAD(P)-dependent oxidoreductase [Pseudonocardia sp. DSM 110487]QYN34729.1 NAD(P)-dependent oxidoreductase [Pseudonocardia sp. DSM 110487]